MLASRQHQLRILQLWQQNNFKMDNQGNSLKVQVRLEKCTLKVITVPAQYSFALTNDITVNMIDRVSSPSTSWKEPKDNIISFNCFLRMKIPDFRESSKCYLKLFSRSDGHISLIGTAALSISNDKCGKIRKYTIKSDRQAKATIEASIYLKNYDNSLPNIDILSSEISSHSNYSTISRQQVSLDVDSILDHLKSQGPQTNSEIREGGVEPIGNKLKIEKEVDIVLGRNDFIAEDAQNLLLKLFEEIGKKNTEIDKKEAELNEKDAEIKHIKMRQLIFQKDQKKIQRLKKQTEFLLAANEVLISKDEKYDEEYQNMKLAKEEMTMQMARIASQTSVKIMCLKTELQGTKKRLDCRQKKLTSLLEQAQVYTREINTLKDDNKEKTRIINNIKIELSNEQMKPQSQKVNLMNAFEHVIKPTKVQQNLLPVQQLTSVAKPKEVCHQKLKKCKSLSLFNANPQSQRCESFKTRFTKNKHSIPQLTEEAPNIISYLLGFHSNCQ